MMTTISIGKMDLYGYQQSLTLTPRRATINGQTYVQQIVPTLYTALSAPAADVMNPEIYGVGSNPFVVSYNDM